MRRARHADRGPGGAAYEANQHISVPDVQALAGHHRPACEGAHVRRGVLLDIPRVRDVPWLEPGDQVWRDDLEAAERQQGVMVRTGDVLLLRTGHARRRARGGPEAEHAAVALHASAVRFIGERGPAVTVLDTAAEASDTDIRFEDLCTACERQGRWELLLAGAPRRAPGEGASRAEPIAIRPRATLRAAYPRATCCTPDS